jgi:alpha-beta hydrolase superfamily lysophospholipase
LAKELDSTRWVKLLLDQGRTHPVQLHLLADGCQELQRANGRPFDKISMGCLIQLLLAGGADPKGRAQDDTSMACGAASMQSGYPSLRMPVTIIAGEEDKVVDVDRHALRP